MKPAFRIILALSFSLAACGHSKPDLFLDQTTTALECGSSNAPDCTASGDADAGPSRPELDACYASADLIVVASRAESYGMVITEALARGLPVVAAAVGGVAEALGEVAPGTRPGMLVAPEAPGALAAALGGWLADADLRTGLRRAAAARRESLPRWSTTAAVVAATLAAASE